jgi:hypothetical protein
LASPGPDDRNGRPARALPRPASTTATAEVSGRTLPRWPCSRRSSVLRACDSSGTLSHPHERRSSNRRRAPPRGEHSSSKQSGFTRRSPPTRESRAVAARTPARRRPRSRGSRSSRRASSRRTPGRPRPNRPPRGRWRRSHPSPGRTAGPDAGGRALILDQPLAAREGRLRILEPVLHHDVHGVPPLIAGGIATTATVRRAMPGRIAWIHQLAISRGVVRIDHDQRGRARRRARWRPSATRHRASRRCSVGGGRRCAR